MKNKDWSYVVTGVALSTIATAYASLMWFMYEAWR